MQSERHRAETEDVSGVSIVHKTEIETAEQQRFYEPAQKKKRSWTKEIGRYTYRFVLPAAVLIDISSHVYSEQFKPASGAHIIADLCDANRFDASPGQQRANNATAVEAANEGVYSAEQEVQGSNKRVEILDIAAVGAEDIVSYTPSSKLNDAHKKKLLLIPVGYTEEEIAQEFPQMEEVLSMVSPEMQSTVAHLRQSSLIDFSYAQKKGGGAQMPLLSDYKQVERIRSAIDQYYKADNVAIIVNSPKAGSSSVDMYPRIPGIGKTYAIINGTKDDLLYYRLLHEIKGHLESEFLDDYTDKAHGRVVKWWEPFLFTGLVHPTKPPIYKNTLNVAAEMHLPVERIPYTCEDVQLAEIDPHNPNNIMKYAWGNEEVLRRLRSDEIFTPLQKALVARDSQIIYVSKPPASERR